MKKDSLIFVRHILESIGSIEHYTEEMSLEQFQENKIVQDAVMRRLEIIGEAVKNLPREFTRKYPTVPWSDITGTRDKLIHHYFGVDVELTFDIVTKELPPLKKELKKIIAVENK